MPPQEIAREEGEDQVGLVTTPAIVDHAHAIRVTVVGDPHVGPRLHHLGHEVAHVLFHLRIGQMVGKSSVRLAVELGHLAAEPAQQLGSEAARDAIAGVHHYAQLPGHLHALGDRGEVVLARAPGRALALSALEVSGADSGEQSLDLFLAERRGLGMHHLHAVVGDGIVTARHGGAAVEPPVRHREVEQRRRPP